MALVITTYMSIRTVMPLVLMEKLLVTTRNPEKNAPTGGMLVTVSVVILKFMFETGHPPMTL